MDPIWLQINEELTSNREMVGLREAYRKYKSCEDKRCYSTNGRADESPNHKFGVRRSRRETENHGGSVKDQYVE